MLEEVHNYNYKKYNPNAWQLLKYLRDVTVRFIVLYGGSSSAKSYSTAQVMLMMTLYDAENTLIFRKYGSTIEKSIYEDYRVACRQLKMTDYFKFNRNSIRCVNGARIDFTGLDDEEKIKGISNYKRVQLEEWSEFDESDFKQIRKRLRGKEGQQIVMTFNPIRETHWIKRNWYDCEQWHDVSMEVILDGNKIPMKYTTVKSLRMNAAKTFLNPRTGEMIEHAPDTVLIQTTYLHNFWVVGSPDGDFGYFDQQCIADFEKDRQKDPTYYQVYALGEWGVIRTGSEFFGSFNVGKHTAAVQYNTNYPIHISVDNNVLPYISVSMWQYVGTDDLQQVRQIGEICADSPNNTVKRSAKLVASRLREMNYIDKLYLHGDASTRAANTIDDEKRSWLDLFIYTLEGEGIDVVDCVGNKNPSVALTGEFINAIFDGGVDGLSILIGDECRNSIDDYLSVQKDVNGAILKTKIKNKVTNQTYEEHGHLSDTFRYLIADVWKEQYTIFSNRRRRNIYAEGELKFYNPATEYEYEQTIVYVFPSFGNRFALARVARIADRWHLTDVCLREAKGNEEMGGWVRSFDAEQYVVECPQAYFQMVRDLRADLGNVSVLKMGGDYHTRISAMSDWVRAHVHINPEKMGETEYGAFINDVLDYNDQSPADQAAASAVLSGLARIIIRGV